MGHQFTWRGAAEPVRVVVLNRRDLSLAADTTVPAMSMYHVVDAWEEGSKLCVYSTKLVGAGGRRRRRHQHTAANGCVV